MYWVWQHFIQPERLPRCVCAGPGLPHLSPLGQEDNPADHTRVTSPEDQEEEEAQKFGWKSEAGQRKPYLLVDCAAAGGDGTQGGKVLPGAQLEESISLWQGEEILQPLHWQQRRRPLQDLEHQHVHHHDQPQHLPGGERCLLGDPGRAPVLGKEHQPLRLRRVWAGGPRGDSQDQAALQLPSQCPQKSTGIQLTIELSILIKMLNFYQQISNKNCEWLKCKLSLRWRWHHP